MFFCFLLPVPGAALITQPVRSGVAVMKQGCVGAEVDNRAEGPGWAGRYVASRVTLTTSTWRRWTGQIAS